MHLVGLAAPAVGRQLASVVGHVVDDHEAEEVYVLTGGNPFFVGEMARVLGDRRSMFMARRNIVETKLRGTAPSSVSAYPCLPDLSLDERQAGSWRAKNTGRADVRR